jgi:hypothetical protein
VLVAGLLRPSNRHRSAEEGETNVSVVRSGQRRWEAMAELKRKIEGELENAAATITDVKEVEQGRLNQSTDP